MVVYLNKNFFCNVETVCKQKISTSAAMDVMPGGDEIYT